MPSSTSSSRLAALRERPWPPRLRGWGPSWAGLASFALALFVWLTWIEPRLPLPLRRRPHPPGTLSVYPGSRTPLYLKGEARAEGWLALGDSRVNHGLDEHVLARLGIDPLGVLWVGSGQLEDMLAVARDLPPRRLLVALSPLSVHRHVADAEADRQRALEFMERALSRRADAAVDEHFVRLRSSLVHWLDTRGFASGWIEVPHAEATDARQAAALAEPTRADRAAALSRIEAALRELRAAGWTLVCVRFPISPSLRAVEDEAFDPALFERLCADLGLPYHDFGTSAPTLDGSHLTAQGARDFAPRLAAIMRSSTSL